MELNSAIWDPKGRFYVIHEGEMASPPDQEVFPSDRQKYPALFGMEGEARARAWFVVERTGTASHLPPGGPVLLFHVIQGQGMKLSHVCWTLTLSIHRIMSI